jgi:GTPase Era involved in 16S rRNA processing
MTPTRSAVVPLKVAVVGHTNTGKTSLLRTLTRDVGFGEVSDRPATTRHVEGTAIQVDGQSLIELYDTPGLEDSIGLLDLLDSLRGDRRTEGVEQIERFLQSPEASAGGRFSQEAKALRQVLASDVALYVIDARDRVLGKHRDELEILGRCARPVVPVLNFVANATAQTALWREHLSRANMHAVAEFDTVVIDEQSERRLLEKMQTLLDHHRATLDQLIQDRTRQREQLVRASADLIADLLIDVAAHVVIAPAQDAAEMARTMEQLKQRVREREQQCVNSLLSLHRFRPEDYADASVQISEGRWGVDLFSPAAMKQFGIRAGSAAVAGGMIGLTVDAMVGGASLGAGFAIGSAIGALLSAGHTHGKKVIDQMRGYSQLRCDPTTLQVLLARQVSLVRALLRRGHASVDPIRTSGGVDADKAGSARELKPLLEEASIRPQWSRLESVPDFAALAGTARRGVQDRLAAFITKSILE